MPRTDPRVAVFRGTYQNFFKQLPTEQDHTDYFAERYDLLINQANVFLPEKQYLIAVQLLAEANVFLYTLMASKEMRSLLEVRLPKEQLERMQYNLLYSAIKYLSLSDKIFASVGGDLRVWENPAEECERLGKKIRRAASREIDEEAREALEETVEGEFYTFYPPAIRITPIPLQPFRS